jgi:hypothetical protein
VTGEWERRKRKGKTRVRRIFKRERERERERESGNLMRGRWGVFNGKVGFSVVVWSGQTCGISF